jgi:hypothetical protein
MKLVIAGGSGFLGQVLAKYFQSRFEDIVILSRTAATSNKNIRKIVWDARTLGPWSGELNDCDVLINLTGKSVNCRYTEKNKKEILTSRLDATKVLGEAIRISKNPPRVWLQAASSTIYRSSFDKIMDEKTGEIGDDFSMNVCKQWERTFLNEECPATKKIVMRIAIVLGKQGGAIPPLLALTKLGLGGRQGSGKQMVSWIHENDFVRCAEWLIENGKNKGIYNCTSPSPVTNYLFMKNLRHALRIPFGIPSPAGLLEIGSFFIRTETELLLKSRWVYPKRLLEEGFTFQYQTLDKALEELV